MLDELKKRMQLLGISPKRSLGQNFLVNEGKIERIIHKTLGLSADAYFEIGPGLGALTTELVKAGVKPTVVELDRAFAEAWRNQGLEVIESDAMKVNWKELVTEPNSALVSNLPYQISSRILVELSFVGVFKSMVLMFQKEVGQRIQSEPSCKEYGLLSVIAQVFWKCKKLIDLGPTDYYPQPNVASRVVVFERVVTEVPDIKFLTFVRTAFNQRRKMLKKNLRASFPEELIIESLQGLNLNTQVRPEDLSPQDYLELYKILKSD